MYTPAPIPENEALRHQGLLRYQILDSQGESNFDNITQLVADVFGAKIVLISFVDSYRQWFKSKIGLDACELGRDSSFCGHAILERDVFYIEDALADERFSGNPLVVGEPHIRTYAGAPIFSSDGYGVGTLCIIYDQVNSLSRADLERLRQFAQVVQNTAESRLNRLILQAEQARQRQMIAIVGHELRTPLVSLQMMQEEQQLDTLKPLGQSMVETTEHLGLVLNDLANILDPKKEGRTNLNADTVFSVIERTSGSLRYLLSQAGISLHFSGDSETQEHCRFNTQAMRQLVTNLLKNAAVHSEASDLWINACTISSPSNAYRYEIRFRDNGKGVPSEHQTCLFDAGFRGDTKAEGSGLGLYICKELTESLGGSINYATAPEGGAEFIISMSLERAKPVVLPDEVSSASDQTGSDLSGKRILVAEDDRTLRMLNEAMLSRQGAEVVTAENGLIALTLARATSFDLVLTDILMPEMDGYELTKSLRKIDYQGIIVGLSAYREGEEHRLLLECGANSVSTKPLNLKKLTDCLAATGLF